MASPEEQQGAPRIRPIVLGGAALVIATLVAGQTQLSMLHHGHDWWRLFVWQLPSWLYWAALTPWLLRRGEASFGGERRHGVVANLGLSLAVVTANIVLSALIMTWVQPFLPVDRLDFVGALLYLPLPWALIGMMLFWLLLATGGGIAAQRRHRELALRESRLEAELARAQLENLRLEMQPHFLFNTLNSIAALVRKKSNDQALEMVLGLSHLLRLSLDRSDEQLGSVAQEMDFVDRYVELHRQRFSDRLAYEKHVEEDARDWLIPSLILQPLVENALRHGIAASAAGGTVTVSIDRAAPGLARLCVEDDGPGLGDGVSSNPTEGIGLRSVRDRLRLLYGENGSLRVEPRPGGGVRAEIVLPVEDSESAAASGEASAVAGAAERAAASR